MKSYYDILAVSPEVSQEEIKKSYRKLSKKYHPDLNPGNKEAETRFKEITEAYAVLSDQEARAKYNAKLQVGEQTNVRQQQQQTAEQHYAQANINFGDMGRQFEQFFGFNPKTGERNQNFGGNQGKNKGPLDASHIFEGFFSPKKK